MKNITLIGLLALATIASSQPYGQIHYTHNGAFLSSGGVTNINSNGFLLAGNIPVTTNGAPNFYIDKTGSGGITSGANDFSQDYQIWVDAASACSVGGQAQLLICSGVSVIETNLTGPSRWYALAGATDEGGTYHGMFFATLDQNGNTVDQEFYNFPQGSTNFTQPLIVDFGGDFIISGSYYVSGRGYMYIMRLTPGTAAPLWSYLYDLGNGANIIPKKMIVSPYSATEVVIVGYWNSGAVTDDAFFLRRSSNSGAPLTSFLTFGTANPVIDQFHSICVANSLVPASAGYLIGGYTDVAGGVTGSQWLVKISPAGVPFWNNVYDPPSDFTGTVVDVMERYSSTYSNYDYWGVCTSSVGMLVIKADFAGNIFTQALPLPANTNSEFIYDSGSGSVSTPCSISNINTGGGPDEGIQVYGTDDRAAGGKFYFVEAYFNGESGCAGANQSLSAFTGLAAGPISTTPPSRNNNNGLSSCVNFSLLNSPIGTGTTQLCGGANFYGGGINYKNSNVGIAQQQPERSNISIYPNPTTNEFYIKYFYSGTGAVKIQLFDCTGRLIKIFTDVADTQLNDPTVIDLSNNDMESGIYLLKSEIGGEIQTQKIVYTKK